MSILDEWLVGGYFDLYHAKGKVQIRLIQLVGPPTVPTFEYVGEHPSFEVGESVQIMLGQVPYEAVVAELHKDGTITFKLR